MKNPLVTVLIPVYNSKEHLFESINSVLNQTYKNIEVIIVDDGSTDGSIEEIEKYSDSRIRLIKNKINKGIPYTRNVGLKSAKGKYIALMDSDDISLPERIEKQVEYLESNQQIDAIGTNYIIFGNKRLRKIKAKYSEPEEIKSFLLFYNPIANPSTMIRANTIEKYNLNYNLDYFVAQDYDLWIQLSKVGNISILQEYLLKYRSGHNNITKLSMQNKNEKRKNVINQIHLDIIKYYGFPLDRDEIQVFNDFFAETPSRVENLSEIQPVIDKLISWNKSQNIFNHKVFIKILEDAILIAINNQKISLIKITIFNQLNQKRNMDFISRIVNIVIKHVYRQLKSSS